jgi:hypothetical protein
MMQLEVVIKQEKELDTQGI